MQTQTIDEEADAFSNERRYARLPTFMLRYDVGRTFAYDLIGAKKIRAVKPSENMLLIDIQSADEYFASLPEASVSWPQRARDAASEEAPAAYAAPETTPPPPPKKRGRPLGSKNRPKTAA